MASNVKTPTLRIPTGYEGLQRKSESRRKIADAMLQSGLSGPGPNATSWTQLLGSLAQAWAGKSMQRDADKMDAELGEKIRADYTNRLGAFYEDAKTLPKDQLVQKYQGDPMLTDALEPYKDAWAGKLKSDENLIKDGSYWKREGDIVPGSLQANDLDKSVIHDKDGNAVVNPVKVTASIASQGLQFQDGSTPTWSMADPRNPPPAAVAPSSAPAAGGDPLAGLTPEERTLLTNELARRARGGAIEGTDLVPNGDVVPVQTKPPTHVSADGRPVWEIHGKFYDNPEGK